MRNKLLLAVPLMLASLAFAQNTSVQGARGEGSARSEDHRIGKFNFEVRKLIRASGEFRLEGRLRFESVSPASGGHPERHFLIEMGQPRAFGKSDHVAEFGGPGVMVVRTGRNVARHQGHVQARVEDNKNPRQQNDRRDRFQIRFNVPDTDVHYGFAGLVMRGDILVFERPAD